MQTRELDFMSNHVMAALRFWGIAWIGNMIRAFIIGAVLVALPFWYALVKSNES